ncbi:MAG: hypothetical protein II229_00885 [Clostridia bacterium]|nr:hypothetical protein [Clostridia bacterium]
MLTDSDKALSIGHNHAVCIITGLLFSRCNGILGHLINRGKRQTCDESDQNEDKCTL